MLENKKLNFREMYFNKRLTISAKEDGKSPPVITNTSGLDSFGIFKLSISRMKPNLEPLLLAIITENTVSLFLMNKFFGFL